MTANINDAIQKIKSLGLSNTRIVSSGEKSCIEVRENGQWNKVIVGVTQRIAEDIVAQATNKVILG
mgnify:CR=1 FL=1